MYNSGSNHVSNFKMKRAENKANLNWLGVWFLPELYTKRSDHIYNKFQIILRMSFETFFWEKSQ